MLGTALCLSSKDPHRDIFGAFNALTESKLLIKAEEADGSSFHGAWEKIKGYITSSDQHINANGEPQRETVSYTYTLCASRWFSSHDYMLA